MAGGKGKLTIGLAGGVGAGKSTVARILGEAGAAVIASDRLNRQELESPAVVQRLVEWFGETIRDAEGRIDRAGLAGIIFDDPQQRARVEGLLHPRIDRRRRELIARYSGDSGVRAIVIDSPLLYETGLDSLCDVVIFVDAPLAQRRQRVAAARGWSSSELAKRESLQKPLDSKKAKADHTLVNNSGPGDLRPRVERLLSELLAQALDT